MQTLVVKQMLQKMGRSQVHCPFFYSEKIISGRFPFLKFQKESVIGIADLKKNAYNISVAFFRVSEEFTKKAVLTEKMIVHSHRVRRQYRAERCN